MVPRINFEKKKKDTEIFCHYTGISMISVTRRSASQKSTTRKTRKNDEDHLVQSHTRSNPKKIKLITSHAC